MTRAFQSAFSQKQVRLVCVLTMLFLKTGLCGRLEYFNKEENFTKAVILCDNENMKLAKIENATEHVRLQEFINAELGYGQEKMVPTRRLLGEGGSGDISSDISVWIGLVYNETNKTFYWISDGSEANYSDWSPDEPSSLPPVGAKTHVIMMVEDNYKFKTADNADKHAVLCEEPDAVVQPLDIGSSAKQSTQEMSTSISVRSSTQTIGTVIMTTDRGRSAKQSTKGLSTSTSVMPSAQTGGTVAMTTDSVQDQSGNQSQLDDAGSSAKSSAHCISMKASNPTFPLGRLPSVAGFVSLVIVITAVF